MQIGGNPTMFVRAIEAALGRILILLVLVLTVGYLAYNFAGQVQSYDAPNWLEGLWFQIQINAVALWNSIVGVLHTIGDVWSAFSDWFMGR